MRRNVASTARITIVSPCAADVRALFDDEKRVHSGFEKLNAHAEAGEARADDEDVNGNFGSVRVWRGGRGHAQAFLNQVWSDLPGVRYDRPDFQFDGDAGGVSALGKTRGVIAQNFVRANVNKKRRKSGEVGVKGRSEGVARIGVAEIVARGGSDVRPTEHGTAPSVRANGISGSGEVGPGRENCGACGERNGAGTKRKHEREHKAAAGGLSGNDNGLRSVASAQKRAVNGDGVIDGRRKLILGREAIIRGVHAEFLKCESGSNGAVRLRGTSEISATVQIEKHDAARLWPFQPFAGDSAQCGRRNPHAGRNSVAVGAKNFACDAIVTHTFQSALDTPLGDPHRKMRLEAGHWSLRSNLQALQDVRIAELQEN